MTEMGQEFAWRQHFKSICNAPLELVGRDDLDDLHPAIQFHRYWDTLRQGKELPDDRDFVPEEIPAAMDWFMLFRRELRLGEDLYHLYRQGDSAAQMTHGHLEGLYLHEFTKQDCYTTRRELMRWILTEKRPGFARIDIRNNKSEFFAEVTVGMFPILSPDGATVVVVPAPVSPRLREII